MATNPLAGLPRMDDLLAQSPGLTQQYGIDATKAALIDAVESARQLLVDQAFPFESCAQDAPRDVLTSWIRSRAGSHLGASAHRGPRRVINAAGIVVHTNLGRAPLTAEVVDAIVEAAGYCDLEYDLATGARGSRGSHSDALLAELTGAEDAVVVNNCASALVLVLATLAAGRQVPVSRGHLVEIGGSFRLPEIMAASGAVLREVGTTNRTKSGDYAVDGETAMLLTVHPSNFTQTGFVTQPTLEEICGVAGQLGVPWVHDAGSGLLTDAADGPLEGEVSMAGALAAGADLVLASGDKLLGGPQAGLIVGRGELIQKLRRAPLMRALRVDKLRLAGLRATLLAHRRNGGSPVQETLGDAPDLPGRVSRLAGAVGGSVTQVRTMIGGGSAPGVGVDSPAVMLPDNGALAAALRRFDPPIVVRMSEGHAVFDLRTVQPSDDEVIGAAVEWARHTTSAS